MIENDIKNLMYSDKQVLDKIQIYLRNLLTDKETQIILLKGQCEAIQSMITTIKMWREANINK